VKAGEIREAEQADSVRGRVAPDRVLIVSVTTDGVWCTIRRRIGGPVHNAKAVNIVRRFPRIVGEA
jgi:hypothetical protein